MRFEPTSDQRDFAASLESLLASSDTASVARAWADGDHGPGLKLWDRLAEQGVTVLATEASPVEVVIAFEALGRHAVPGPWVESAAYLPIALGREVEGVATVAVPPHAPYALDADIADAVYLAGPAGLTEVTPGASHGSVDRTRRLFSVEGLDTPGLDTPGLDTPGLDTPGLDTPGLDTPGLDTPGLDTPSPSGSGYSTNAPGGSGYSTNAPGGSGYSTTESFELAALATAAQLLGLGERVLADTVTYAKQRRQFGREIGSYQAIKHQLADVRIALDFARPLVHGAALDPTPRAVSAAKVMCADAAYLASRTGLQVHGAIGYTQEFDLSIWITKIRALVTAWGTPAFHRARILTALTAQTGA